MKRLLAAALLFALVASPVMASDIHGAWTMTPGDQPDRIYLSMTTGGWHQFGRSFTPESMGVRSSDLWATTTTPVSLKLDRDAGTLVLEGTFRNGDGARQFTFAPSGTYAAALRAMGLTIDLPDDRSIEDELFTLAIVEVSLDYVRTMRGIFPEATLRDMRRARGVNVTPESVNSLRQAGLALDSLRSAVRLVAVGATADYIRSLRAAGAGYTNLSTRDLVQLAAAGVDARFIRSMSKQ